MWHVFRVSHAAGAAKLVAPLLYCLSNYLTRPE